MREHRTKAGFGRFRMSGWVHTLYCPREAEALPSSAVVEMTSASQHSEVLIGLGVIAFAVWQAQVRLPG
jgi:hypothetical protein